MKRIALLSLVFALTAPGLARAQLPPYTAPVPPPVNLDPGTAAAPAPAPAPPEPSRPQVVVVGPDGKVVGGDTQAAPSRFFRDSGGGPLVEPGIHAGPTPELHVVRRGDTLWDICYYYFNDPWQWPKIWSYNPQITNPHWIYPGDVVRLVQQGLVTGPAEPEKRPDSAKPIDNVPPPRRNEVGVRQIAFVEKADLDRSITLDGSIDEKVLLGDQDAVYLSYPKNHPPTVGDKYSIYIPGNEVKSKGRVVGAYVHILGTVQVTSVKQDKQARGLILGVNSEIERGAKVGPLIKQFRTVAPAAPEVDAQGSIVAMLTRDQLIGQGEVVFIDLGKRSGLVVGNRMFVVRRGDAYPETMSTQVAQDDRRFPARALGEVVIVDVGENISIGLVTLSVQEMSIGDLVMMQKSGPEAKP